MTEQNISNNIDQFDLIFKANKTIIQEMKYTIARERNESFSSDFDQCFSEFIVAASKIAEEKTKGKYIDCNKIAFLEKTNAKKLQEIRNILRPDESKKDDMK